MSEPGVHFARLPRLPKFDRLKPYLSAPYAEMPSKKSSRVGNPVTPRAIPMPIRLAAALVAAMAFVPVPWSAARAQQVVVMVNGKPITAGGVAQRSRPIGLSSHKAPPRDEVGNALIHEKLKRQIAKPDKPEITQGG